ncbi:MAG: amino acid-binding protein [Rhodospirillaceae bacterium]|jgi:glycine cleavage system transcriptional repressor|nr:amino acid-binding protein [Rhodospirillaceae bacterium]MBT4464830.1 amino acid-binding protein [Rhodospirillaceae bacterium]MBT5309584.1 amino acid-binding protein [Rhodospirillaceae bacterium]MBT7357209.1 amino acid-binding protein [Rhodospirillaceae bacterium]
MATNALISITCPDRVGIISEVTGHLFDLGISLGDTTFSVLGAASKFTTVCTLPAEVSLKDVEESLVAIELLKGAEINVSPFELSPEHDETAHITHRIVLKGDDQPGLIARLSEVFSEFKANVVRLNSCRVSSPDGCDYEIRFGVWIPEENVKSCLATVDNTARSLGMACRWHEMQQ